MYDLLDILNLTNRMEDNTMKEGRLFFDHSTRRFDVVFDKWELQSGEDRIYGGLHCGQILEIFTVEYGWMPTRIEYDSRYDDPELDFYYGDRGWYLVGMESITSLSGRTVRIYA